MCTSAVDQPKVTHEMIARELKLARTTVTRILNNDPTYRASQKTRDKVFAMAHQLGYDFSQLRRIHRRRYERHGIKAEARLRLILDSGQLFDEGHCTIKNISLAGALLGNLRLPRGVLPLTHVIAHLEILEKPLAGITLTGEIVRCAYKKNAEIAIAFTHTDHENLTKLEHALASLFDKTTEKG